MPEIQKNQARRTNIGALRSVIREHLKSQVAVARAVGVSPQAVSEILRRGKRVPAEWCLALEQATGGAVTRHDLRPDLYPNDSATQNERQKS